MYDSRNPNQWKTCRGRPWEDFQRSYFQTSFSIIRASENPYPAIGFRIVRIVYIKRGPNAQV